MDRVTPDVVNATVRNTALPGTVTQILEEWAQGDAQALEQLIPRVYSELRRLARYYFENEAPGHTLQPTALVNEVYLRLSHGEAGVISTRSQFFGFAARLMREILVDHARARRAIKRGGGVNRVSLIEAFDQYPRHSLEPEALLALDQAIHRLGHLDTRQRQVVELRFFGGLTLPETATVLGVSHATVERDWAVARRFLAREMAR